MNFRYTAVFGILLLSILVCAAGAEDTDGIKISIDGMPAITEVEDDTISSVSGDTALQGRPVAALKLYNEAIELGEEGKYTEALEKINEAIEIDENIGLIFAAKAGLLAAAGDLEGALAAADKATELNPQQADAWINKATVYNALGRYSEALEACNTGLALNPSDDDTLLSAYINKGTALGGLGRYEEEIEASKEALKIDTANQLALSNIYFAENALEKEQKSPLSPVTIIAALIAGTCIAAAVKRE